MASSSQSTFLLSAANVSWGRRDCYTVKVNDAAVDLDGEYYNVDAPSSDFGSSSLFYVWFNLDGGSTDPAPAGRSGIEIAVSTGEDAAAVALALSNELEAINEFRSKLDPSDSTSQTVIMEAAFKGPVDNAAADVDSGVSITRQREGLGGELGKTSGGVEITMETTSATIQSDQTGQIVLDEFYTGQTVEVSTSFLEMTPANWETIVGSVVGDTYTPSGGTQLTGFGESRLYSSFFDLGGELVLHPIKFDASDKSNDITLFKSVPKPASYNYSGEEASSMEVTFTALLDGEVKDAINLMAFGDSSQDVRA